MDGSTTTPEDARPRIRLRLAAWERQTTKRGLRTNAEAAYLLGTSESTIHRIKAADVEPSGRFIASVLWTFGSCFEDLFEVIKEREPIKAGS